MTSGATVHSDRQDPASGPAAPTMRLELEWCLPRQAPTVAMARRLLSTALHLIGVAESCRADLALAVTEACANAVRHAHGTSEYQLVITVVRDRCVLEVIDRGVGADHERLRAGLDGNGPKLGERGRGLRLIRACTDTVEFGPVYPRGLTIRMVKALS